MDAEVEIQDEVEVEAFAHFWWESGRQAVVIQVLAHLIQLPHAVMSSADVLKAVVI